MNECGRYRWVVAGTTGYYRRGAAALDGCRKDVWVKRGRTGAVGGTQQDLVRHLYVVQQGTVHERGNVGAEPMLL